MSPEEKHNHLKILHRDWQEDDDLGSAAHSQVVFVLEHFDYDWHC